MLLFRSKCLLGFFPALIRPVVVGRTPAFPAARGVGRVGGRRAAVVGPGVPGVPGVPGLRRCSGTGGSTPGAPGLGGLMFFPGVNENFRILKWRYVSTICLAIVWGYIP